MALDVKNGAKGVLSGASTGASIGSIIPGLGTTLGGIIGGGLGLIGGLFGGSKGPTKKELMEQAWQYEKEGMAMQYNYGQQAANEEYKRNLKMWDATNFEAQRRHMENADLSVGLMYGNGGGQAASTAGGSATQPSGPKANPVELTLQQEAMGLQLKQIEAQNKLASAQTAKTLAEANKIADVDTKGQKLENKWKEIENRIQLSRESIEASNVKEAAANANKAIEEWKQATLETEYLTKVQEERVTLLVSEIAKIQKEGSVAESVVDVNYHTARKIQKEVDNLHYEIITRRMSAEAAKESADNMLKKIENDYKLGSDKNLREWIYGGIDRINGILDTVVKFKNGQAILKNVANKIKK